MIAYSLNKEINCGNICNSIQNLITKFIQDNPDSQGILVIQIKNINDSQEYSEVLRLEHKN
jgi:hypothetical protein